MFSAIGRWIKSIILLLTGRVDSSRRGLDLNPHVVRARYDQIVREKTDRIQQYKQAVAGLISQQVMKMSKVKTISEEVERLERLRTGALAKAKQTVAKLQGEGKTMDEIKVNEDYMRCLAAYNDFSSTLEEKKKRIVELEEDLAGYSKNIKEHKVQLEALLREIDKLKAETAEAVTDIITAKDERDIADTLAGIAQDGTAEELQRLRQMREEAKAGARISKELAGIDTRSREAEFLEYAQKSASSTEFDTLIGLAHATEAKAAEKAPAEKQPLPE
jgi:phage shock protein A